MVPYREGMHNYPYLHIHYMLEYTCMYLYTNLEFESYINFKKAITKTAIIMPLFENLKQKMTTGELNSL